MSSVISPNHSAKGVELGELLAGLGTETAAPLFSALPDRRVLGTDFYESTETLVEDPGLLLLAPSCAGLSAAELHRLASRAVANQYAAIAVKCQDEEVAKIESVSAESKMPFIRVSESIGWRLFDALLSRLLGERGRNEPLYSERGLDPLFELADEVAEVFGGSVAIEDLGRSVIAYSSVPGQAIDTLRTQGILLRKVPDVPSNDFQYEEVLRAESPIKYPSYGPDELPRVAFPIRAGALPLGSIWAIDATGDEELTPGQDEAMRNAARTAASYMLEDIRTRRAGQMPREDRLRTLLDGHSIVGSELLELGIPRGREVVLIALEPPAGEPLSALSQLRSTVQRHLSLRHPETVTAVKDHRVFALLAYDGDAASDIAEPLLGVLDRQIAPGARVAVAGSTRRATEIARLRGLANRLFEAAQSPVSGSSGPVLTVERLRPDLLFERLRPLLAESPELQVPGIDDMIAENPEIAGTLLAWCGAFGNVAASARILGIHENTVRYRLQRARELYGVELDDADARLTAWIQLRVG